MPAHGTLTTVRFATCVTRYQSRSPVPLSFRASVSPVPAAFAALLLNCWAVRHRTIQDSFRLQAFGSLAFRSFGFGARAFGFGPSRVSASDFGSLGFGSKAFSWLGQFRAFWLTFEFHALVFLKKMTWPGLREEWESGGWEIECESGRMGD
ncbi:unnamed protein product [Calypogeia fissa]